MFLELEATGFDLYHSGVMRCNTVYCFILLLCCMKRRIISKPFFRTSALHYFYPRSGQNLSPQRDSKLCFLLHDTRYAAKNACPARGEKHPPKSVVF